MGERVNVIVMDKNIWRTARCSGLALAAAFSLSPAIHAQAQAPILETPQQSLETPQHTNERIRTLTMGAKNAPHDYIIGNGDLVGITVFDVPELSRDVRVSQLGSISIPLVPVRLGVAGLTELQAEQKISEVLEANGLVSHPEVAVMVKEHKSKPITIVGAVVRPMVYEADRTVTLLEALAEAGGIASDAGDTVIITRVPAANYVEVTDPAPIEDPSSPPGAGTSGAAATSAPATAGAQSASAESAETKSLFPEVTQMSQNTAAPANKTSTAHDSLGTVPSNTVTINLNDLLETGDTRNNITLRAGDVVTVPHAGIVYVLGAVTRPGGFVLSNDRTELTTLKILSLAGGLTNIAKLKHAVIIRKDSQGKQTETEVDLKMILQRQSEDVQMHASDILYVPDDRTKEALLKTAELAIGIGSGVALYRLAYH
jgi:protein involved in polysaccharide export with SLBB domain